MFSLRPTSYKVRRRLFGAPRLEDVAVETVVVSPGEDGTRPTAITLPGQNERVQSVTPETTWDIEMARVRGGAVHHAATLAHRLKNVHYIDGYVYTRGLRQAQTTRRESLLSLRHATHIKQASLPASFIGDRYFGFFLTDVSATCLLAQTFAPAYFPYRAYKPEWPHAADYHKVFGFRLPEIDVARIDDAWVFQDFGMTASRRDRFETLRRSVSARGGKRSGHGVFIWRRNSGAPRLLANEAEVAERLLKAGFELVDPSTDSVDEIISRASGAAIVCSVEGSALSHAFLTLAPRGAILALQPPYQFDNVWKDYTDLLEMKYGYVVGEGSKKAFSVDPDEVLRTVDLLLR